MSTAQWVLSAVLAAMVFSVALDLRWLDFHRVLQMPRAVVCGLVPQFVLLPAATLLATLALDLPPNLEVAMILVAACPGGALSNVITHLGRGNTALSVSISAVAALLALVLTPFNFAWMVASNPATAGWMRQLQVDPTGIAFSLLGLLAVPMAAGLLLNHHASALTTRLRRPLKRFALLALLAFVLVGLVRDRHLITAQIILPFLLVVAHNACGLLLGWAAARAFRLGPRDRRAVIIEGGMQNAGLALGIIALQFDSDVGMVVLVSQWGMWHIVTGLALARWWRAADARPAPGAVAI
ncbi:MAG: bile acid:sodium symporter family protein [Aquabacterium sp.]